MGRYNRSGRSRSYSPRRSRTPPPPTRRRYDDPRDSRYDDFRDRRSNPHPHRRRSPAPSGLLVRNISLDSRPEDLRIPFERFGPVKDVYLPKNYYTGEPRGFGFVKFCNAEDAAEAKHQLNHCVIGGREIAIVFAEENRKTPREMRTTSQPSGRYGGGSGRRSPPRFSRRRSYSRSLSPARREFSNLSAIEIVEPGISLWPNARGRGRGLDRLATVESHEIILEVLREMGRTRFFRKLRVVLMRSEPRRMLVHHLGRFLGRHLISRLLILGERSFG
ncbi:unnamed protein product [Lactuca saligna]|uniref:RRM domain-containing protein n=1 Tax=Lactuca saligna TaxID=75948 RepID=A0AA36E3J5_LACSI|nr:unnamed protein product [Lactuca saligna]